ncbi:MAG: hypothetical protein B7X55_12185, partial [Rhodobacterales bacterium 34-62-10]
MECPLIHNALKIAGLALKTKENLAIAVLGILAAVVTGPFDTSRSLTFPMQVLYWTVIVLSSVFVATLVQEVMRPFVRTNVSWQRILAYSLGMGAVYAPICYLWTCMIVPPLDGTMMPFHWFVIDVTLISYVVFAMRLIMLKRLRLAEFEASESGAIPGPADEAPRPLLYRRIAATDPGPILRIEALDHFVNVVTPLSTYQMRLRFADAVEQMEGVAGVITHRSHWVACDAIEGVQRENGRLFLRVKDGEKVPVSRKYRAAL